MPEQRQREATTPLEVTTCPGQQPKAGKRYSEHNYPEHQPRNPLQPLSVDAQDIYVEQHSLRKGSASQKTRYHHVLNINIGPSFIGKIDVDGQSQTGLVLTGSVNLFPAQRSNYFAWDRTIKVLSLNCSTSLLRKTAFKLFNTTEINLIPVFAVQDPLLYYISLMLYKASNENEASDNTYLQSLAEMLAVHLLQHFSIPQAANQQAKAATDSSRLSPGVLEEVLRHVKNNLQRRVSLEELAMLTHLSQYHFSRAFKQTTGLTPHQYVIQARIEHAKSLLQEANMNIGKVAMVCGFSHASHFSRHFKKLVGITPREFLKTQQEHARKQQFNDSFFVQNT